MRDIDRAISQALASEAEAYVPGDLAAAERRFITRRRRRRFTWFGGATVATAAAVVAVAVLPRPELVEEGPVRVAGAAMTTVRVGDAPVSLASSSSAVWVTNSGDGTVSRIDPDSNEVVATIEVGGFPEEVVADEFNAWVYEAESRKVIQIDPASNDVVGEYTNEWPAGTHLDLALKGVTLWMADPATQTAYFHTRPGPAPTSDAYGGPADLEKSGLLPERGGDVALESGGGEVWSYNGRSGTLTLLMDADGAREPAQEPDVSDVLTSENGDLAVGGEALWVSDDQGVIMRVDRRTYRKDYLDVGGRHSDLSYGGGYLWALTADAETDGNAVLRKIDPTEAEVVGEPITLEDSPVDVSADQDSVWVAHRAGASVTRIDVTPVEETPAPDPSETSEGSDELLNALSPDDLVMVFSGLGRSEGDLFVMYGDGGTERIKPSPELERSPSFVASLYSKNPAVVVEQRNPATFRSELSYVDVVTGKKEDLVAGSLPEMASPSGQLAYWRMEKGSPTLFITQIGTDFERQIRLAASPADLAWDAGGRFVYVLTQEERPRILSYDSTAELGTTEASSSEDRLYLAAASRTQNTVDVISLGRRGSVELGTLTFDTPDPGDYRTLVDLSELGIQEADGNVSFGELRLTPTGKLDAVVASDGTISWGRGDVRSWVVGYRTRAWLVKETGDIVDLGHIANGGLAVAPELLLP